MGRFGQIKLLPKALKGYPKSNKSANLVTLVRIDKSNTFDNFYVSLSLSLSLFASFSSFIPIQLTIKR